MKSDSEKWNRRYGLGPTEPPLPDDFLVSHLGLLGSGRGLDVACGFGANALFLAEHGFQMDAVDISSAAIAVLHSESLRRGLDVACFVADLDEFPLPSSQYDVIIVFQFFSEQLVFQIKRAVKPGATIVYSTFNTRHTSLKPGFNPAYLVLPDALCRYFSDFQILVHEPAAGDRGNVSRLIGRKPPA